MFFRFFDGGMLTIAKIFFGFSNLLSCDTMYLKITLEYTRNMHLLGFNMILNSQHLSKQKAQLLQLGILITKDIEIIQKYVHENAQISPKGHIYYFLINGWGIFQTEQHDNPYESPPIGDECCFVSIFPSYHNLMVA